MKHRLVRELMRRLAELGFTPPPAGEPTEAQAAWCLEQLKWVELRRREGA